MNFFKKYLPCRYGSSDTGGLKDTVFLIVLLDLLNRILLEQTFK